MVAFGIPALLSPPLAAAGTWQALALDAVAWVLFVAAATFRFWSTLYIGGRKTHTLACEGPYSITRNPLYLGTFLLWLSGAVFFKSLTLMLGAVVGLVFYLLVTIPIEEKLLLQVLGKPYEDYCRTVPRLWPRFSLFHTPPTIVVSTAGLWTECRRASRWLCVPLAAAVLAYARSLPSWPTWFHLP
jgi:protein-S-isoprenylcysteine O-methyltransferase Ste14